MSILLKKNQIENYISDATQVALDNLTLQDVASAGNTTTTDIGIKTTTPIAPLHVVGTVLLDRYGTSNPNITQRTAGGTDASPTAIASGRNSQWGWQGHTGSAFASGFRIFTGSTETWTPTANGTEWNIRGTKTGGVLNMIFGLKGNGSYVFSSNLSQTAYDALTAQTASLNVFGDVGITDIVDFKNESGVSRFSLSRAGALTLGVSPATASGSYEIPVRNTSTGIIEKVAPTAFVADTIVDGITTVAPSQNAVFDALALKVDKVTTLNQVYGTNNTGAQTTYEVSTGASLNGTVLRRTPQSQAQALTLADTDVNAAANDLINRGYVDAFLRSDRVAHATLTNGGTTTIDTDEDVMVMLGAGVASHTVRLPSPLSKYRRIIVAFEGDVTNLTIDPGVQPDLVTPNTIDYSPTTAKAGYCYTWGYDWNQYKWLIVSAWEGFTAPTAPTLTSTTQIATTEFVYNVLNGSGLATEIFVENLLERQIEITSAGSFPIVPTRSTVFVTFTGTTTTTTLPPIAGNEGMIIFLTNAGSGLVTVNSNLGANDIWEGGVDINTTVIPTGTVMRVINDGLKFRVL